MRADGFLSYLMKWKKRPLLVLLALLGVACLLLGGFSIGGGKESSPAKSSDELYRLELEARLTELLCRVDGVGSPEVMVTLERGEEHHYSGSKLLSSDPPRVLGVAVVCRGGGRDDLRA